MKPLNLILIVGIILISLLAVGYFIYDGLKTENKVLKALIVSDIDWNKAASINAEANDYYDSASLAYENNRWDEVVSNCESARGKFLTSSQDMRGIQARLKDTGLSEHKIIGIYQETLGYSIEYTEALYEACEHFESAARYYKKYYQPSIPVNDVSYDMGAGEIQAMNEKINKHDEAVRKFNSLIEDLRVEVEKIL